MRYAWFRDSSLVVDRVYSTAPYTTVSADIGHNLQLQVTYEYTTSGTPHASSFRSGNVAVGNQSPNQPDAQSPPNGAVAHYVPGDSATNPSFTARFTDPDGDSGLLNWSIGKWNGSSFPTWQTSTGSGTVFNTSWGTFFPNTMNSGLYSWSVTPQDNWGANGTAISNQSLQVYEAPGQPSLSFPANAQTVPNPTPNLKASATDAENDTIHYRFQLATDSSFTTGGGGSLVGDFYWLASGAVDVPTAWPDPLNSSKTQSLKHGKTYYWRAQAADVDGGSIWSSTRSFTVAALPNFGTSGNWPLWSNGAVAVNEANGNLVISAPTPNFPTSAGTLGVGITYNSHDTVDHGLGAGWTIGDNGAIKLVDHALVSGDGADEVERFLPDGSSLFYQRVDQQTIYLPTDGSDSQLTKNPGGTYTLVDRDGSVYTFGAAGTDGSSYPSNIETLAANAGNGRFQYTFDSQHRLTSIVAKDGTSTIATLTLTWGCSGGLLCISGPDGVSWKYISDGSGRLQTVNNVTRDLFKVTYSSGMPQYVLNADDLSARSVSPDPNLSPGYSTTHDLLIGYASNNVTSVTQEGISGQTPSSSIWAFDYHPDASGATTTDATAAAHGTSGQPGYYAAGSHRITAGYTNITPPCQHTSGTCAGRSGSAVSKVYYDDYGQPMERIDLLGNITQSQYSQSGHPLWSEDQAGNPTDYSYDPVDQSLGTVTAPDPDGTGRTVTSYHYDETVYGSVSGSTYTPGTPLHGLQAYYYKSSGLINASGEGRADAVKTELSTSGSSFLYTWGSTGPPAISGATTNYSVRFVGDLTVGTAGDPARDFQFRIQADDGATLTVDGQFLINHWGSATALSSPSIHLAPGKHRVVLEYHETASSSINSSLALLYQCVDATNCTGQPTTMTNIPSSALTPAWNNRTSTVTPTGRVAFSHYDKPWTNEPDYTLVKAPVAGTTTQLITSYVYDTDGRLQGKVIPNGNTSATINSSGDLTGGGVYSSSNYGTAYAYYTPTGAAVTPTSCTNHGTPSQLGLLNTTTQHGLHVVTTIYSAAGLPASVANGKGTTTLCYDNENRLVSSTSSADTQSTTYSYDPARLIRSTTHSGTSDDTVGTDTIAYDEAGRPVDTVDANGAEATVTYDADGQRLTRVATPASGGSSYTTSYAYDNGDRLSTQTDPAGHTYSFGYDSRGNLTSTQYPNGTYSLSRFDHQGRLTDNCNHHGTVPGTLPTSGCPTDDADPIADTTYTYNADGQTIRQDDTNPTTGSGALGKTTIGTSTASGNGSDILDLAGPYTLTGGRTVTKLTGYIASGSSAATLRAVIYADNSGTPGAFEAISNEVTLPASSAAAWVNFTLPANVTLPAGSYWVGYWFANNNTIRYYDAVSNSESYEAIAYSSSGNPPSSFAADGTNNEKLSLYATLSSATASTTYSYDSAGRLAQVGFPSNLCRKYSYDADSNRSQTQESTTSCTGTFSTTATYTYTTGTSIGVDQLTSQTGPTRSFTYDTDGNTTGRGSDTFGWDGQGRLKTSTASATTVNYIYDPAGALKTRTTSSPTTTTNYLLGDLFETNGSGTITSSFSDGPAGDLARYDGPPTGGTPGTLGKTTIGATSEGNNGQDILDLFGPYNLSSSRTVTKLTGYVAGNSAGVAKVRAAIYSDNSGSPSALEAVTNEATLAVNATAAWVDFTLPSNVSLPAGNYWVGYWYGDDNTTRYHDTVTSSENYSEQIYSSTSNPPSTFTSDGTSTGKASLYATLQPSGGSTIHYLYYDGHGSLTAETDVDGNTNANHSDQPFGAPNDAPSTNTTSHRYVGRWDKQYDSADSVFLMGVRPYDPALGRFLAVDPVDGGSLNNYDYAGQDPVNGYDLGGLHPTYEGADTTQDALGREANGCASDNIETMAYWCQQLGNDYGAKGSDPVAVIKDAVVTLSRGVQHNIVETTVSAVLIVHGTAMIAGGIVIGTGCTVFTEGVAAYECADAGYWIAISGGLEVTTGVGGMIDVYGKGKRKH